MTSNSVMVNGISPRRVNVNIRVKLLRMEIMSRKNFDSGLQFLDLIVCDEEGGRIGVTIKNALKSKYETILIEHEHYLLKNVFVINNPFKGKSMHWEHESKLMLTHRSSVLPIAVSDWNGVHGFNFVEYNDLINCNLEEGVTADVIGRVHYYSEEKKFGDSDELKHKYITVDLKDLE